MPKTSNMVRDKILETSRGLFARFGLRKTTVDEISRSVNMGKSSLYYYFTNKEDIFKAVIEKELAIFGEQLAGAVKNAGTVQEKLQVFAVQRMKYLRDLSNVYSAVRDAYLNHYSFIKEIRSDYDQKELELVKGILQQGTDQGVVQVESPEVASRMILIALKGFEYEWTMAPESIDIERNIGRMVHVLLNGIGRSKTSGEAVS